MEKINFQKKKKCNLESLEPAKKYESIILSFKHKLFNIPEWNSLYTFCTLTKAKICLQSCQKIIFCAL